MAEEVFGELLCHTLGECRDEYTLLTLDSKADLML